MHKVVIQKNTYRDSVSLMLLSDQVRKLSGIADVAVLMGTSTNKQRLISAGFDSDSIKNAGSNDLCIGIHADTEIAITAALQAIEEFITGKTHSIGKRGLSKTVAHRTLKSAVNALPGAQIVSISLPGEYAGAEARRALEMGLHVFLFSNNVSLQEEKSLKSFARERGYLLMGPDCGTALINGFPLGFCNVVPRGPVGVVAASGTGAQELMSLIAANGIGISHILGTGGRDLDAEIGGLTFETAIKALGNDDRTEVIVLISKPPAPEVELKVISLARTLDKPVVISFIGGTGKALGEGNIIIAEHLAHAAQIAAALVKNQPIPTPLSLERFVSDHQEILEKARQDLSPTQCHIRGLYSGGTLADEAALILAGHLPQVRAGQGFGLVLPIEDWEKSYGNMVFDLGEDRFTQGRPHPMIDSRIRVERILAEKRDPSVAVILLDVVLGMNAEENPAQYLVPAIKSSHQTAGAGDRKLVTIVHICGTEFDPQNLALQTRLFEEAGCLVFKSNVEAALAAAWIVQKRCQ